MIPEFIETQDPAPVRPPALRVIDGEGVPERPRTRGDCAGGPRPCPWVGCRYHIYMEVRIAGGIAPSFQGLEPWELEHTCALDCADEGGLTLDEVGARLGVSRERVRQVESAALRKIKALPGAMRALESLHQPPVDLVHPLEEF